jgi:hypothetical protein
MGHRGGQKVLGKTKCLVIARTENHTFSASGIHSVSCFKIIVITDFCLTGLDLKVLALNDERYIIYGAKEPVLKVHAG